jgi:hypothetical protein
MSPGSFNRFSEINKEIDHISMRLTVLISFSIEPTDHSFHFSSHFIIIPLNFSLSGIAFTQLQCDLYFPWVAYLSETECFWFRMNEGEEMNRKISHRITRTVHHELGENARRWPHKQMTRSEPQFWQVKHLSFRRRRLVSKVIPTSQKWGERVWSNKPPGKVLPIYPGNTRIDILNNW